MKKLASLLLALVMLLGMVTVSAVAEGIPADKIKIGYICIGDENEGFSYAHYAAVEEMRVKLGLSPEQIIMKGNIPETEACYDAAVDLAEQGCNIIFGNSFSFESYLHQAAAEYPEIQFCHATGVMASSSPLTNVHNYFSAIHDARYVSGVVAGMKLNQMIEEGKITAEQAKIGYVGAKPFAEVISGYTAFFLGARSVCPTATMTVKYTGEWSDMALEKEAAEALIADKCVLVSQHSDTTGPASACEAAQVPFVGYNISMIPTAPTQALTSAAINWEPYITYVVESVIKGEEIVKDWGKGFSENAVRITELNEAAVAPGTVEKVAEIIEALSAGTLHVFDCSTFTVGGETLTSFDKTFGFEGNELVWDGYFHEGELRSAPCFEIIIDGITVI